MAKLANTFTTYDAVGNRESLADKIYRISPEETPFVSAIGKGKAKAVFEEWQTDDLAAPSNNKVVQGNEASPAAVTPTVRMGNRTQISEKTYAVTGTQEAVDKAGRKSEVSYQDVKKMVELKRDIEFAALQNSTAIAAADGTAPQSRGVLGFIHTNTSIGATGDDPDPVANTAQTDGTQRAFTETLLNEAATKGWNNGAKANLSLYVPSSQRAAFSGFDANATKNYLIKDKELTATIDVYQGDFGTYKVVNSRYQRQREVFGIDPSGWSILTLRPFKPIELAKTGDNVKKLVNTEWTLKCDNPLMNFAIRDLTTS
ncbi:DUF5309 domain-containing protein [Allopusillimonas ginsengisoli]|uniref:DUF5309 domain-containing protein n=1 Tax=Allopusillimonas ginsengisoli TaxID=453575 RepID=UPI00101EEA85|nr:DUF5309 domain-containing protein [Allopusillimonas ginsengisoli]TEA78644.1 head protein [Allopusillimonas ginsengisoli]